MEMHVDEAQVKELWALADRLGVDIGGAKREGVEGNTAGIESENVLFSRRLDSRTYFVQDRRFGIAKEGGTGFDGSDDELVGAARGTMERLEIPAGEIAETAVLAEQAQEGRIDETGNLQLEPAYAGKRQVLITRQLESLPVWSSSVLLGLNWDKSIGFLQLHWPEIPEGRRRPRSKLHEVAQHQWTPPERPGAKVESVEAENHPLTGDRLRDGFRARHPGHLRADRGVVREEADPVSRSGRQRGRDPRQFEKFEEPPIEKRPELPNRDRINEARGQFKSLLLANPNYFGTLGDSPKPELVINGDTFFEEIGCIGYEPELRRLGQ